MTFSAIGRTSIWMQAAEQLRDSINDGTFRTGQKLPSERVLCDQFGISRVSLREALRALSQDGYISIQSGRGAFVLPSQDRRKRVLDSWIASDRQSARKTFELRMIFEPNVAALVATKPPAGLITELEATIETMAHPQSSIQEAIDADSKFHQILGENTGNDLISALVLLVMSATGAARKITLETPEGIERAIAGHRRILAALEMRDPEAAKDAMSNHLTDAIEFSAPQDS